MVKRKKLQENLWSSCQQKEENILKEARLDSLGQANGKVEEIKVSATLGYVIVHNGALAEWIGWLGLTGGLDCLPDRGG